MEKAILNEEIPQVIKVILNWERCMVKEYTLIRMDAGILASFMRD